MRKAIRVCSLLCMALLLVGIMSCGNVSGANGSEPDTWTKVTNINDIKGTWEGSITIDFLAQMKEGSTGDPELDALCADTPIKTTVGIKYPVEEDIMMTLTMDLSDTIEKIAEKTGMESSEISQLMEERFLPDTEATQPVSVEYFKEWVEAFSLTINQHKTKLKMEVDMETYVILDKK